MSKDADHAHRRRASVLGGVTTMLLAALGAAVLRSAWHSSEPSLTSAVPVEQALLTLVGWGAGVAFLTLAWVCALGSLAARPGASMVPRPERPENLAHRWGARAGAVLLALTMATPGAHAGHVDPSGLRPTVAVAPLSHSGDSGPRGTEDAASPEEAPEPRVALPGWDAPRRAATDTTQSAPGPPGPHCGDGTATVVVARGDTLWGLARADLGRAATEAHVVEHWPRWYTANRATIGPDPDLIRPGQVLRPPSRPSSARCGEPGAGR
jgi:hypothetical protein